MEMEQQIRMLHVFNFEFLKEGCKRPYKVEYCFVFLLKFVKLVELHYPAGSPILDKKPIQKHPGLLT